MSPPPATAAATRTRPSTRRGPAPRVPRRVSGHVRPRAVTSGGAVALPRPIGAPNPWRRRLRRAGELADHRLVERILTGRAWIAIVGCALIGIVFMQVSLLKLNAGIGASVERASTLDRQNAELRAIVSELGSNDRIQAEAQRLGLVAPPPGSVTFLGRNGRRVGGDAPIALAQGTATKPELAGTGSATTAAATTETQTTTTATPPSPQQPQQQQAAVAATQPQQSQPQPQPAQPVAAAGTPAGGATPAATATTQQP